MNACGLLFVDLRVCEAGWGDSSEKMWRSTVHGGRAGSSCEASDECWWAIASQLLRHKITFLGYRLH